MSTATEELMTMLRDVEVRAAELRVPAVLLVGMLTHVATSQSMSLNARAAIQPLPTLAQQIMSGEAIPK